MIDYKKVVDESLIVWDSEEKIPTNLLEDFIGNYLSSDEYKRLDMYKKYYDGENPDMVARYLNKKWRGKTPNNYVPTAYYSTVVDTMSGYMFSNVTYEPKAVADISYTELINDLLEENNNEVKEMKTGVHALAYNKGIELVYTTGDGKSSPEIKYTNIPPKQMLLIYDNKIEPSIFCGVRITKSYNPDYELNIDVIYKDEWQFYYMNSGKLTEREEPRPLIFQECPVIIYNAEIMNHNSPFQTILPYIDALDYLISGNSNEIQRLVDAILVIGSVLSDEDKANMDEWKVLEDMKTEDRAEYLTKDMSPAFREYVSKLLINEIHKHSHVIDWYSPDSGITGEASAKALRTRLFDMDMYSNRIEKVYRDGAEKRIRLLNTLLQATGNQTGEVNIVYNRTKPDDFEDKAPILNNLSFLSTETKLTMLGLDAEKEKERIKKESEGQEIEFNVKDLVVNDDLD